MPDLLIRNVPPELHARLKAAAAAHRRSVTQEAIQIFENNLSPEFPPSDPLPASVQPHFPSSIQDSTFHSTGERPKNRSQPGWAKETLRILHPIEGLAIPESDWNMLNDALDPLK